MGKRKILIGNYDTASHGWTLTSCKLDDAEQKTNYVDRPGGDGAWDLSTALTDGIPVYKPRPFTATLECSEGDRPYRNALISEMVSRLHGTRQPIELPDDIGRLHITGRIHIAKNYSDLAHCSVTITANCDPWKARNADTVVRLTATQTEQTALIVNNGGRAVLPTITVTGEVLLKFGTASKALSAGTYQWPDLLLTAGTHELRYSGTGSITLTYREAVLE